MPLCALTTQVVSTSLTVNETTFVHFHLSVTSMWYFSPTTDLEYRDPLVIKPHKGIQPERELRYSAQLLLLAWQNGEATGSSSQGGDRLQQSISDCLPRFVCSVATDGVINVENWTKYPNIKKFRTANCAIYVSVAGSSGYVRFAFSPLVPIYPRKYSLAFFLIQENIRFQRVHGTKSTKHSFQ